MADLEDINRWVARDGPAADFVDFLANDMNIILLAGNGGALFAWRGPRIYEVHVFFEQRGKEVLRVSHEMLRHMREEFAAQLFWSAIPTESRHVIMFTRLMGWKSEGVHPFPQGDCEVFSSGGVSCLPQ